MEKERIVKEKQRKELVPKELLGKERRNKREKTGKEVKTKENEKKSKILVRTKINCQIALKHGKEEVVKEVANYQKMLTDLPDGSKCKDTACLCMVQKAAATQFKIANQLTEDRKATILMNTRVLCVEKFMEKPHNKKQLAAAKYQCASINWNDLSLAKYRADMVLKKKKLTSAAATAKC